MFWEQLIGLLGTLTFLPCIYSIFLDTRVWLDLERSVTVGSIRYGFEVHKWSITVKLLNYLTCNYECNNKLQGSPLPYDLSPNAFIILI